MLCTFTKPDGTSCKAHTREGRLYCLTHDPAEDSARIRQARSVRGGRKSRPAPRSIEIGSPSTPQEIADALRTVAIAIADGSIDAQRGRAIAMTLSGQLEAIQIAEELADAKREIERLKKRLGVSDVAD